MNGIVIGAGYVGRSCISEWPDNHTQWTATTTREEKIPELLELTPRVEIIKGKDFAKLSTLIDESDFALVTVAPKDRSKYKETYLDTAQDLANTLRNRSKPFYLLYTSSTSVYGDHQGYSVDESSSLLTDNQNGKILIETEKCYLEAASNFVDVCILRLGGIHGPGREINERAKKLSGKTMTGKNFPTNHSPLPLITKGIYWCFQNRLTGIYNLVEDAHPTKNELYGSLLENLNLPPPSWEKPHSGGAIVSNQKLIDTGFRL